MVRGVGQIGLVADPRLRVAKKVGRTAGAFLTDETNPQPRKYMWTFSISQFKGLWEILLRFLGGSTSLYLTVPAHLQAKKQIQAVFMKETVEGSPWDQLWRIPWKVN
jgi:hypothetical protein